MVSHLICTLTTLNCTVLVDPSRSTHSRRNSLTLMGVSSSSPTWCGLKTAVKFGQNRGPLVYNRSTPASTTNHCIVYRRRSSLQPVTSVRNRTFSSILIYWCGHTFNEQSGCFADVLRWCAPSTTSDQQLSVPTATFQSFVVDPNSTTDTVCVLIGLPTNLVRRLQSMQKRSCTADLQTSKLW